MTKETTDISEFVGLVSMDSFVVFPERLLEAVGPDSVQLAESFSDKTVKVGIGAFLRATFDNHVAQLDLESESARKVVLKSKKPKRVFPIAHLATLRHIDLHQLMHGFLKVELCMSATSLSCSPLELRSGDSNKSDQARRTEFIIVR